MTTPAILLEELLRYRESPAEATAKLEELNHDDLCKLISEQLHLLLDAFQKYQYISYVVQSPRDSGVDLLLKESHEDAPDKYIALQVKSYAEVADKNNELSKQLKGGFHDSDRYEPNLLRYYILLFGDARKHSKRLSAITNEFAKKKIVHVIGPRDLLTFINMPPSMLAAIVDRQLSDGDYVRKKASKEASGYSDAELYFLLACLTWAYEKSADLLPDDFFANSPRMVRLRETYSEDEWEDAYSTHADRALEMHAEPASTRVRAEDYPAIRALYFDIQVRYGEDSEELFDHLFEFLRL